MTVADSDGRPLLRTDATFAHLAGADPTDHQAAAAGLPKVDVRALALSFVLVCTLADNGAAWPAVDQPVGLPVRGGDEEPADIHPDRIYDMRGRLH